MKSLHDVLYTTHQTGYCQFSFIDLPIEVLLNALRRSNYRITTTDLQVKFKENARQLSLSKKYGTGRFPFHTDFAFRAIPPRYIALCNPYSTSFERGTSVCYIQNLPAKLREDIRRSIWDLMTASGRCVIDGHILFAMNEGYRWDCDFLQPANKYAIEARGHAEADMGAASEIVRWKPQSAVLIDNWKCTHARMDAPELGLDSNRKLMRYEAWGDGRMVTR